MPHSIFVRVGDKALQRKEWDQPTSTLSKSWLNSTKFRKSYGYYITEHYIYHILNVFLIHGGEPTHVYEAHLYYIHCNSWKDIEI